MMKPRARTAILCLAGLGAVFALIGWQIQDYPFRKSQFGTMEGTRKFNQDKSEAEVKKIMKVMADGIGVKCVFCHNEKDYTSDEKPMKDFVRKKMYLVDWMNHKYRPATAKWEYSCYTCHRGSIKPVPSAPPLPPGAPKGK